MFANKHAKSFNLHWFAPYSVLCWLHSLKATERQKSINIQRAEDLSDRLKAVEKNEMNYLKKWKSCRQKQVTRLLPEK